MPKILLTNDHDLLISNEDLAKFDVHHFEVSPWANDGDGNISAVNDLEEAEGVSVYARLTGSHAIAMCIKDFDIGADMTADNAQDAAVKLAETLNAYLPGNEPMFDEHLEAMYEDRVSGPDFDWEY
jgi:hypothetical protein